MCASAAKRSALQAETELLPPTMPGSGGNGAGSEFKRCAAAIGGSCGRGTEGSPCRGIDHQSQRDTPCTAARRPRERIDGMRRRFRPSPQPGLRGGEQRTAAPSALGARRNAQKPRSSPRRHHAGDYRAVPFSGSTGAVQEKPCGIRRSRRQCVAGAGRGIHRQAHATACRPTFLPGRTPMARGPRCR